jgi:hypothetical protein
MGILVLPDGFDQLRDLSTVHELLEFRLKHLRLVQGQAEAAVLLYDHPRRKEGQHGEAKHYRASEPTNVS